VLDQPCEVRVVDRRVTRSSLSARRIVVVFPADPTSSAPAKAARAGNRFCGGATPTGIGINTDTIWSVAMTLRLDEQETEALRRRAELEGRSMQEVARDAVRTYIEQRSKRDLLDRVLDEELPRYAEALERLGQ
jgi:hypothetical protein